MSARPSRRIADIVDEVAGATGSEREVAVALHDFVRDEVAFGFTPWFDDATPEQTLRFGVGHCNPQARLMVELFRAAGLRARFKPVTIDNAILRGAITTPPLLSHVFTEVMLDGRWLRLDSYIVDAPLREAAVKRLEAEGRALGYGCHARADRVWEGAADAFSQVATADMIVEEHEAVDEIETFYASPGYRHRVGPLRFAAMMSPGRLVSGAATRYMNVPIEALRRKTR